MTSDYAATFVTIAVNAIMKAHKRANIMAADEIQDLAARIVRRKKSWSFADVKVFADMVIEGQLGEPLKSVDISSIMEKAAIYDTMRGRAMDELQAKDKADGNATRTRNMCREAVRDVDEIVRRILTRDITAEFEEARADWCRGNEQEYQKLCAGEPNNYYQRIAQGFQMPQYIF